MKYRTTILLFLAAIAQIATAQADEKGADSNLLSRHYRDGERGVYHMTATNQQGPQTISYEADAVGVVKKGDSGIWYEEIGWTNLIWNHEAVTLSSTAQNFRELLSLDPRYKLSVPNLGQLDPRLIGPVTDLLTFYSDLALEMRQSGFTKAGAHTYFQHGV